MRTIDSSISVLKPSNIAWWHTSWTGRFILAALLIAAVAFVLTPGRTSAQATTLQARCADAVDNTTDTGLIADCVALITAAKSLTEDGRRRGYKLDRCSGRCCVAASGQY